MTVSERAGRLRRALPGDDPMAAIRERASDLVLEGGRALRRRWNYGTPIWEREWDLLIVLDACRWDLFREVAPAFEFVPDEFDAVYSPASHSEEWLEVHTEARYRSEMRRTALVSGNINTCWKERFREGWGYLDEVWRRGWDDDEGTVPARAVTDATIDYVRERAAETPAGRTIAWYFQPHRPFVPVDWSDGFAFERLTDRDRDIEQPNEFKLYREGEISRERLWRGYAANLRYVLEEVGVLLRNVDAERAVITADHANLLGECGVYEHPRDFPHPALRRVPWVPVTATDERTRVPSTETEHTADTDADGPSDAEIESRLQALGYAE